MYVGIPDRTEVKWGLSYLLAVFPGENCGKEIADMDVKVGTAFVAYGEEREKR